MTELTIDQAVLCAKAAKLAYAGGERLTSTASELGFGRCDARLIEKSNHAAVVINCSECCIFAFRGTEIGDLNDWRTIASISSSETPLGDVHEGFWDATLLFSDELQEFERQTGDRSAFLSGHSLGGAMACLACVRLDDALNGVYTFAQPPVGTREFGAQFITRFGPAYSRIINALDDVPKIPIPFLDAAKSFRPMGPAFELFRNGELRSKPSFWLTLRDRLASARYPWERVSFRLHSMDEHIRRLELVQNAN